MDKMYMISEDEYLSRKSHHDKKEKKEEIGKEPEDIAMVKLYDKMIRKQNASDIKTEKGWSSLQDRLKPIWNNHSENYEKIIKQFPPSRENEARFILSVMSKLPKVKVTPEKLYVNEKAIEGSMPDIVNEIISNKVHGVESLIEKLRSKQEKRNLSDDWEDTLNIEGDTPFESLSQSMHSFINASPHEKKSSTPKSPKFSPLKTRGQRMRGMKETSPRKVLNQLQKEELKRLSKSQHDRSGAWAEY